MLQNVLIHMFNVRLEQFSSTFFTNYFVSFWSEKLAGVGCTNDKLNLRTVDGEAKSSQFSLR